MRTKTTLAVRHVTHVDSPKTLLERDSPESRRVKCQLTMSFKIINDLVDITPDQYLIQASSRIRSHHSHKYSVCSWFYQWYQWYTNIVQGYTNGTIGKTIGTNGNANGTICSPNGTVGTIGKPMVPLATNCTIGKITTGTIGRTPNTATDSSLLLVTTSRIVSSQGPLSIGIPFQPLWRMLPVWYLSNGSLAPCHSNLFRAGRMQVNPSGFSCCAGWDSVIPPRKLNAFGQTFQILLAFLLCLIFASSFHI